MSRTCSIDQERYPRIVATTPGPVCLARYMCHVGANMYMPRAIEETWLLPLTQRLYIHRDPCPICDMRSYALRHMR